METVRKGRFQDLIQVKELWAECFGDDAFAEWFFAKLYSEEFLYVCEMDETIVSMAFCLPKTLILQGKSYRAWYLYGIGTKQEFRGHGYAKRLISFCTQTAKEHGMDLCLLIPAEQSLFSFYRACGFDLVWTRAEENGEVLPVSYEIALNPVLDDFSQVNTIYERVFDGYFKRSADEWGLLCEEFRMANGDLYQIETGKNIIGYCFAVRESDRLNIRELGLANPEDKITVCHALANTLQTKTWNLTQPGDGAPFTAVLPFAEDLRTVDVFINCDLLHN